MTIDDFNGTYPLPFWSSAWHFVSTAVLRESNGGFSTNPVTLPWDVRQLDSSISIEWTNLLTQGNARIDFETGVLKYTPDHFFSGEDVGSFVVHNGDLVSKPVTVRWSEVPYPDPGYFLNHSVDPARGYVDALEPTEFEAGYDPSFWFGEFSGTTQIIDDAAHGTVTWDASTNRFLYTPASFDPEDEEPYVGWDTFSVVSHNDLTDTDSPKQWIQVNVGFELPPPPPPPVKRPRSEWLWEEFDGTFSGLKSKLVVVEDKYHDVVRKIAKLGEAWETVDQGADLPDDYVLQQAEAVSKEYDAIRTAYLTYLDALAEIDDNLADYRGTWSASWHTLHNAAEYTAVVEAIEGMNRSIGGLTPEDHHYTRFNEILTKHGEAASLQSDFLDTVHQTAVTTHKVLENVEFYGGLATGGTYSGAKLLTTAGLKVLMKTVAKNYVRDKLTDIALTPVMTGAVGLAVAAGVNPEYVRMGMMGFQLAGNIKALKGKCKPGSGECFVAGTGVVTGIRRDGTLTTTLIEDIRVGDRVLARDEHDANDDLDYRRVVDVFQKTSDHLRTLVIAGDNGNVETLRTTDEHPFWVDGRGWTEAGHLREGDLVQESDGSWQTVRSSTREDFADGISVYNFEVEGDHTYFVEDGVGAADAVWVHNLCIGEKFFARIKSRGLVMPFGLNAKAQKFKLRPKAENDALQLAAGGPKKDYAKSVADDPSVREAFLKNGVKTNEIDDVMKKMKDDGKLPFGWDVHHIKPTKWCGDNSQANFIIVKNDPWHTALTSEQNIITNELKKGGLEDNIDFEVEWVVFPPNTTIFAG